MDKEQKVNIEAQKEKQAKGIDFRQMYTIQLLFTDKGRRPEPEEMREELERTFGKTQIVTQAGEEGKRMTEFALMEKTFQREDKTYPVQLVMGDYGEFDPDKIPEIQRRQQWSCKDSEAILKDCKYRVIISDFMTMGLPYKERCNILLEWLKAAMRMFPGCIAIWFTPSAKLLSAGQIYNNPYKDEEVFFYSSLNVRFFKINESEDMVVDTLGLYAFNLPDIQYFFHGRKPQEVVRHAYSTAAFVFANNAPVKNGAAVSGLDEEGQMSREVSWPCHYAFSLIRPVRGVMDVCMNEYASGNRKEMKQPEEQKAETKAEEKKE